MTGAHTESSAPSGAPGPAAAPGHELALWPRVLTALFARTDLTAADTSAAMHAIMNGTATGAQIGAFLAGLRAKGETVEEMAGLVEAMLASAVRIDVPGPAVDVVGTGGDRSNTVNISTMAALVVAGAGERVVKHGNRASSSMCGSADLLEELGVDLELDPPAVAELAAGCGITFCFAQRFHPAMRHAAGARRELGVPTAFNFLGPLTNPAQPAHMAVGVGNAAMAPLMAGVLARRGTSALVFRGDDGLDELTTTTTSQVWVVAGGDVRMERFDPAAVGVPRSAPGELTGGDRAFNAAVATRMLAGEQGPVRDAVLLNAAAALATMHPAQTPLADRISAGLERATAAVDSGSAAAALSRWVSASRELSSRSGGH